MPEEPDGDTLLPGVAAEVELQMREEAWLEEECRHDRSRREVKKRKTGGVLFRQKSFRWLAELDNMLNMPPFDIGGLKRFQVPADWKLVEGEACLDWPCLVVSADQGPDSWCAQSWLESPQHGRLNIVREPDSHNHGLHNDALGAVMDINFGGFLYSATVVLNLHFMPWNNGAFGKKISEAAASMRLHSSSAHPVFSMFASTIGREKGFCDVDLSNPSAKEQVWAAFLDSGSLWTSGQKVGMCRWFQVFVSLRRLFQDWTSLLVVLVRSNLDEPWMRNEVFGPGAAEPVEMDPGMPGVAERRVQTKCSVVEEIRQLRKAVRNAMHFSMSFLSTPLHRRMCGLVVELTRSVQEWYHAQAVALKSSGSNRSWLARQLKDDFWKPFRQTFKAFGDASLLDDLGFKLRFSGGDIAVQALDARLCDDEFMALHMGKFAQALVKRRIFRSAWLLYGWPGRFASLLDEGSKSDALADLRGHFETYQEAEQVGTKYLKSKCERGPFRLPCVRQIVEPIRANGWEVPESVLNKIRVREGGFKQSRIVENGFLQERRHEATARNFEMAELGVFCSLATGDVLAGRFDHATHNPHELPRGFSERLPQDAFRAKTSASTIDLSSVRGPRQKTDWISHSPGSWTKLHLEPYLLHALRCSGDWASSEKVWMVNLIPEHQPLLIRRIAALAVISHGASYWGLARARRCWCGRSAKRGPQAATTPSSCRALGEGAKLSWSSCTIWSGSCGLALGHPLGSRLQPFMCSRRTPQASSW